jgi:2-iminobutanoate/2-iminopropanoate deaminase
MKRPRMSTPDSKKLEYGPVFAWSRTHDGLIFTSGHAAVDVDTLVSAPGSFEQEARMTLENLRKTLEKAGSGMDKVLKVTVYLTDMADYAKLNDVYSGFFPGKQVPARTCIEVSRLPYNFRIEVDAIAHT